VISEAFGALDPKNTPKSLRIGCHRLITKQIIIIMSATVAICSTKSLINHIVDQL